MHQVMPDCDAVCVSFSDVMNPSRRIGWATGKDAPKGSDTVGSDENTTNTAAPATSRKETAQIHVSFISKQVDQLISEATIRSLFSNYGEVLDVALKKSQFDKVQLNAEWM